MLCSTEAYAFSGSVPPWCLGSLRAQTEPSILRFDPFRGHTPRPKVGSRRIHGASGTGLNSTIAWQSSGIAVRQAKRMLERPGRPACSSVDTRAFA